MPRSPAARYKLTADALVLLGYEPLCAVPEPMKTMLEYAAYKVTWQNVLR